VETTAPQVLQNRLPGVVTEPHEGQVAVTGEPQSSQNA